MANHKSAVKRARQNEVRRLRNKGVRTRVKGVVKDVRTAAVESSGEPLNEKLKDAQSVIDRAAKKGVIHKRAAARKISRLAKAANKAAAAS